MLARSPSVLPDLFIRLPNLLAHLQSSFSLFGTLRIFMFSCGVSTLPLSSLSAVRAPFAAQFIRLYLALAHSTLPTSSSCLSHSSYFVCLHLHHFGLRQDSNILLFVVTRSMAMISAILTSSLSTSRRAFFTSNGTFSAPKFRSPCHISDERALAERGGYVKDAAGMPTACVFVLLLANLMVPVIS